ncbi:MAG: TRAP transporter small permease subunit [Desulfovibrionaceae bacterium]|jgi:TRAP-type mannitol/chloroaromatic compound transport system permease small subunit|nr:TRAP transporter small permease subunit [Desulfovibrionaceae bacterium]
MLIRCMHFIDAVSTFFGRIAAFLSLALVLLVVTDVAMRYFFSISFVAVQELEWHIYAAIFLLGAAHTLRHDAHVRVDIIYHRLSPKRQALINVLGCLIFLFPGCFLAIKTSIPFVQFSFSMHEISPDPGGLPARWFLKSLIPFCFALLGVQGIAFFLRNLIVLRGGKEE